MQDGHGGNYIEDVIRIWQGAGIASVNRKTVFHVSYGRIITDGLWRVAAQILCLPDINPMHTAMGNTSSCFDSHQTAPTADIKNCFIATPTPLIQ